jgi:hypothetical protein
LDASEIGASACRLLPLGVDVTPPRGAELSPAAREFSPRYGLCELRDAMTMAGAERARERSLEAETRRVARFLAG